MFLGSINYSNMEQIRKDILSKAREYLGVPFKHQGRNKERGVDCAGLVVCVARDLGLSDYDSTNYGRLPHAGMLKQTLDENLIPIHVEDAQAGDIYLMTFDREPQHLAIVTDYGIIHSYAEVKRVVEHRLDKVWTSRIAGAYRFKGV